MKKTLLAIAVLCITVSVFGENTVFWGSTDVRYMQYERYAALPSPELSAWRGERVSAQAVISVDCDALVSAGASDLKNGKGVIPASCIECSFVDYVMADYYGRCGEYVSMQPDRLVPAGTTALASGRTMPLWISVQVPRETPTGKYKGSIVVTVNGRGHSLPFTLNVSGRTLPAPSQWSYHLDLWQNPYAVARYFDVPLWSDAHFKAMRPIMEKYASAGGKVITASIIRHPWNSQTFDPFESMVVKTKCLDGSWRYDYTVFDRWVEFALSCGVTEQIDCYSIVPWGYSFDYFDLATSSVKQIDCEPGEQAYEDYILPFLTDFAAHLKERGWFDRTCIAMDERPMEQLIAARKIVQSADPGFKIAGAVNYSPEVVDIMYDVSVCINHSDLPESVLSTREAEGRKTTIYTCCSPEHPNTFTFSPLAEAEYLGLSNAARHYGGYLRWALCSWPEGPCSDSRFRSWVSGDTYLLYPEGSSIRFERLLQGVQDFEKVRILREEGDPATEAALNRILAPFKEVVTDGSLDAAGLVRDAVAELNRL
ncbi:MAG: DUF4091 domain-containing protein [Bacteroidales bacterium]|nr:DUF4091 domain-containing protein [Bacteroidales bacterium]